MKDEAGRNSLNDLIASGGLPEATPTGEKTREQLIADKDAMRAENARLKAERDAEFVRGLEVAQEIITRLGIVSLIQAEIEKAKAGKPTLSDEFVRGLQRARQIADEIELMTVDCGIEQAIAAEIDKVKR